MHTPLTLTHLGHVTTHYSYLAEAWQHQVPPLPFELQVLEVVLGDVVAIASQLARDLEAVVHPALDSLMKSVSPLETCTKKGNVMSVCFQDQL